MYRRKRIIFLAATPTNYQSAKYNNGAPAELLVQFYDSQDVVKVLLVVTVLPSYCLGRHAS
jgi:hypothetical protein